MTNRMSMHMFCTVAVIIFLGSLVEFQVVEAQASNGDIRLRDGDSSSYGRVEIFYNGQWGTVCGDEWDLTEAAVVCRQLGFKKAEEAHNTAKYGEGSGIIWLDDVQCSGYENLLYECLHSPWGEHNCWHSNDAGVTCSNDNTTSSDWDVNGDIRLRGGSSASEGRVEVYFEESWHTVCDDQWDLNDARVVCRQLGYPGVRDALMNAYFGQGSGTILLEDALCYGYETVLLNCPHDGYYDTDCSHSRDAGVRCTEEGSSPYEGEVRLVGSSHPHKGRVEIYHAGEWGTVCDKRWYDDDAEVICRQLGYGGVEKRYNGATYGIGSGPIMYDLDCRGYEWTWKDCPYDDWDTSRCSHGDDAGVSCLTKVGANMEGKVRLAGKSPSDTTPAPPSSAYYGRVEIYHNDEWGTVCDDFWDWVDADVVCRQLGFPSAIASVIASFYGSGSGPTMLDDVRCDGWEHELSQCGRSAWYWDNCGDQEDAGARCTLPVLYYPRLADGYKWYEGRVEVWDGGRWERVCATNFYEDQASALCKQLGFVGYEWIRFDNRFGVGESPPSDVGFYCDVDDYKLSTCNKFNIAETDYCNTVAVRCNYSGSLSPGAICGIVFSCLLMVLCMGACVAAVIKQSKRKNRNQQMQETAVYQAQPNVQAPVHVYSDGTNPPGYYPNPQGMAPVYPPPGAAYPPSAVPSDTVKGVDPVYPPTSAAYPPNVVPSDPAKQN